MPQGQVPLCLPRPASELALGGDLILSLWTTVDPEAAPDGDGWYLCNLAGQSLWCQKICEYIYIWCAPGVYLG